MSSSSSDRFEPFNSPIPQVFLSSDDFLNGRQPSRQLLRSCDDRKKVMQQNELACRTFHITSAGKAYMSDFIGDLKSDDPSNDS
jgi:hypothetical protein